MARSSKLFARKGRKVLLVKRRRDRLWMLPGGQRRRDESDKDCARREIGEELPRLRTGRLVLWKEVGGRNPESGRKMSDAVFIASKPRGRLLIGDADELEKAAWRDPSGMRLTPTTRYVIDRLLGNGKRKPKKAKKSRKRR